MATYSTSLKTWGSSGSIYPDGYSYVEGEQPVDAWDNFFNSNVVSDIDTIISALNDDVVQVDGSNVMSADLDFGGNGAVKLASVSHTDGVSLDIDSDNDQTDREYKVTHDGGTENLLRVLEDGNVRAPSGPLWSRGARLDQDSYQKQEGGTIESGDMVVVGQFNLADGETLNVTQAVLSEDGFTTPADSGIDLIIAFDGDADSTDTTTIISGDGTTLYDNQEGDPLASRSNSSGGAVTAAIAIDNGHFNSGTGSNTQAYGGYNAYIA